MKNLHSITTLIVTNNHNNNYNNSNNDDHNDDNKSNSNDNFICLLIRIIVTLHCNSIFVRFLFHTTRHSAFQNIPPFRHSIIPSNGVALLNSSYRISDLCSLHKFSGSFEHLSLIEMVKWSLFGWIKLFFKVSTMCRSNLFRYFGKEKVFFSIMCRRRHCEVILRCLSSIVVICG